MADTLPKYRPSVFMEGAAQTLDRLAAKLHADGEPRDAVAVEFASNVVASARLMFVPKGGTDSAVASICRHVTLYQGALMSRDESG